MARVKLIGGIADGCVTYVADDVDAILIPKAWATQNDYAEHPPVSFDGPPESFARYVRARGYDVVDMCWVFVADGTEGLS